MTYVVFYLNAFYLTMMGNGTLVCKRHFKTQTLSDKTKKIILQKQNNA